MQKLILNYGPALKSQEYPKTCMNKKIIIYLKTWQPNVYIYVEMQHITKAIFYEVFQEGESKMDTVEFQTEYRDKKSNN